MYNNNKTYLLFEYNEKTGNIVRKQDGSQTTFTARGLNRFRNVLTDHRTGYMFMGYNNPNADVAYDLQFYLSYVHFLTPIIQNIIDTHTYGKKENVLVSMVDSGFLPVMIIPSFMNKTFIRGIEVLLNGEGIPVYKQRPKSLLGNHFDSDYNDLYVHREDVERVKGIPIEEQTMLTIWKEIL